MFFFFSF
jgi:tetratricopeptide (TPR) repeat protein